MFMEGPQATGCTQKKDRKDIMHDGGYGNVDIHWCTQKDSGTVAVE